MCSPCKKRTRHLVVAYWALFSYSLTFGEGLFQLFLSHNYSGELIARSVYVVIGIILTILDIYGIRDNNTRYMIPFFVWMVFSTVLTGVLLLVYIVLLAQLPSPDSDILENVYYAYVTVIVIFSLSCILNGYFCYVIWAHRKEVDAQNVPPVELAVVESKGSDECRAQC